MSNPYDNDQLKNDLDYITAGGTQPTTWSTSETLGAMEKTREVGCLPQQVWETSTDYQNRLNGYSNSGSY